MSEARAHCVALAREVMAVCVFWLHTASVDVATTEPWSTDDVAHDMLAVHVAVSSFQEQL